MKLMPDILGALRDTRHVLYDLRDDQVSGARKLRARADLLTRATMLLESRPASEEDEAALVKLAVELRRDAFELRRRHRAMQRVVRAMMD